MSPQVWWKMAGRHRNPSSCGSDDASCPDASGYKEYVTRCCYTTTKTTKVSEYVFVLIPGGVVQLSSYLFVGCQTGLPALRSSVHRVLSMRPEHQSQ